MIANRMEFGSAALTGTLQDFLVHVNLDLLAVRAMPPTGIASGIHLPAMFVPCDEPLPLSSPFIILGINNHRCTLLGATTIDGQRNGRDHLKNNAVANKLSVKLCHAIRAIGHDGRFNSVISYRFRREGGRVRLKE